MNLKEAIRIFGLNPNRTYTEEEIKKIYRELVKKYHPDNFKEGTKEQKEAEEKFKKINNAYNDHLKNGYLKGIAYDGSDSFSRRNRHNAPDLEKAKKEYIDLIDEAIKAYVFDGTDYVFLLNYFKEPDTVIDIVNKFRKELNSLKEEIKKAPSYMAVFTMSLAISKIKVDLLYNIENEYYKQNNIPKKFQKIIEEMNLRRNLELLSSQKMEYESYLENGFLNIVIKYKSKLEYKDIKTKMLELVNEKVQKFKAEYREYMDFHQTYEEAKKEVETELESLYKRYINNLKEYNKALEESKDETTRNQILALKDKLFNSAFIDKLYSIIYQKDSLKSYEKLLYTSTDLLIRIDNEKKTLNPKIKEDMVKTMILDKFSDLMCKLVTKTVSVKYENDLPIEEVASILEKLYNGPLDYNLIVETSILITFILKNNKEDYNEILNEPELKKVLK